MDRRIFVRLVASGTLALPLPVFAQPTTKVWRIGYLRRTSREPADIAALRLGLHELGYVEGQNLVIDERYANGDAAVNSLGAYDSGPLTKPIAESTGETNNGLTERRDVFRGRRLRPKFGDHPITG